MSLSWNEVRDHAIKFTHQWAGKTSERVEAKTFMVYNKSPWPQAVTEKQKAAQKVQDARKEFPDATLADLYAPVAMPPKLVKVHAELDKAVDRFYRSEPFSSDRRRVEYLFAQYEQLTAPLVTSGKVRRNRTLRVKDSGSHKT